jgi:hypothetical protein
VKKLMLTAAFFAALSLAAASADDTPANAPDAFTYGRWQGRLSYKDASGRTRAELYELILSPDGACIVTVSGKEAGADVFQDGDGLWSHDDTFFRLECDFPAPVFAHIPAIEWISVYQFSADKSRFTLLVKPYPDAAANIRAAFVRVVD